MSRSVALVVLTVVLATLSSVLVMWAAVVRDGMEDQPGSARLAPNLMLPRPEETAPATTVGPIHRALHTLGRVCRPGAGPDQASRARRPLSVILDFAREYPDVGFAVHDETGTVLSLLFVAREEVQTCAPALTARVERLIPAEFLTPVPVP